MNPNVFREYDIRGIVGRDLTKETVAVIAKAVGHYFLMGDAHAVSIGYDARESSPEFADIFIRELNNCGLDVLNIGMVPTPLLYFSQFSEQVEAGVMITGSHNPAEYNGFKLSLNKNALFGEQIQDIFRLIEIEAPTSVSGITKSIEITNQYLDFVRNNISLGTRQLKVVVDAGNGIAGTVAVPLLKSLGIQVIELFTEPDSRFPNHHPDPSIEENLRFAIRSVHENKADLAIVFDGDGDRLAVIDERGNILRGDDLTTIFVRSVLVKNPGRAVIGEVKCSQRLFDEVENYGGKPVMVKAGYSIVRAKMQEVNAILAGEMSGHIFFADRFFGFDDAIYAAARMLEIVSNSAKLLSEYLADLPEVFNTAEIRTNCTEDSKFRIVRYLLDEFQKTNRVVEIDGVRIIFENGWAVVRASNTHAALISRYEASSPEELVRIRTTVEAKVNTVLNRLDLG